MCDTFVALGPMTKDGSVIFGKNSDRPQNERQPLVYFNKMHYPPNSQIQCTYISIPQVEETNAILLSKPSWMWGGEMGTNEYGVTIGNEAVWTREPYGDPALLGMDLLRLALERSSTANQAVKIIIELLENYGQGGSCAEDSTWTYHNSFLIADQHEAWVLETAGKWWIAQQIKEGIRNISNNLSIRTEFDLAKDGLVDYAVEQNYCSSKNEFDFAKIFSEPRYTEPSLYSREGYGFQFLNKRSTKIKVRTMMEILRDHTRGICMHGGIRTTASQISWLQNDLHLHWFTLSPHPCISIFKPFIFPFSDHSQVYDLWEEREHLSVNVNEVFYRKILQIEDHYLNKIESMVKEEKTSLSDFNQLTNAIIDQEKDMLSNFRF
ncbi:MAG: C69 family dipeptidase [Candidatus Hodarchaeales archaeon]|jgi:secernin